jgi:transcriptional regulator with XRE-family HTH domain
MIMLQDASSARRGTDNNWLASALARYAKNRREQLNLTAEEAAGLSGMEVSEWYALESGWVPENCAIIQSIAATLRVRWTELDVLVFMVRLSQEAA